jgi:hypothetical protein
MLVDALYMEKIKLLRRELSAFKQEMLADNVHMEHSITTTITDNFQKSLDRWQICGEGYTGSRE